MKDNNNKPSKAAFKAEILNATHEKPINWRLGQFVFNYIDYVYGVARTVQFQKGIDCFYNDDEIDAFIDAAYDVYIQG